MRVLGVDRDIDRGFRCVLAIHRQRRIFLFRREVRFPTSLSFSRRINGQLAEFYVFVWKATKDQRTAVPYEPYYTGTPRPDAHASLHGWVESYAERDMVSCCPRP